MLHVAFSSPGWNVFGQGAEEGNGLNTISDILPTSGSNKDGLAELEHRYIATMCQTGSIMRLS